MPCVLAMQSIPKLTFPGGGLIGCSAGFVNVPNIKVLRGVWQARGDGFVLLLASVGTLHGDCALLSGSAAQRHRLGHGSEAAL